MTSKGSDLKRVDSALIRIKEENKQIRLKDRIILKLTRIVLFIYYFESSSCSLCTNRFWFKTVFKENQLTDRPTDLPTDGVAYGGSLEIILQRRLKMSYIKLDIKQL